ncbi:MAG: chloride channel protein [Endomicrobiales bacterium]
MPKKHITESIMIFISIAKWLILATGTGILVGISTALFLKTLDWSIHCAAQYTYYFLLLPVAFLLCVILVNYLAPDAKGHGTEKVIEAVHKNAGRIKAVVVPVKFVATVITIALGGSAGKEGPSAQIGAGTASLVADLLRLNDHERKKLVICGISAGFASVFGTPIAGAIFGVEVLFAGRLLYDVLLPSFIAGIVSFQVTSHLGIHYFYHFAKFVPVFTNMFFIDVVIAGILFGICAILFIEIVRLIEQWADKIKTGKPLKAILGGLILVLLVCIFSKDYLGLGLDTIKSALEGHTTHWYSFIVKAIFTGVTLGFGGSGGIITPVLFTGAASGTLVASLLHVDPATFAAIGLVSVLAGATNTPIASSIMAIELFGSLIGPYAAISCVISYFMTGHRSVYPSQVFEIKKSQYINFDAGSEVGEIQTELSQNSRIVKMVNNILQKLHVK